MYVVDVLPFAPNAPATSLSYRSREKFTLGDIVTVTLRRKNVPAVVVGISSVLEAKTELKSASFAVSGNISSTPSRVPAALMHAAKAIADWHASALGAALYQLLSPWLDGSLDALTGAKGPGFTVLPVERPYRERVAEYRAMIAECAARKRAALLVVPTIAEVAFYEKSLADLLPVVLAGSLNEKKRAAALAAARDARSLVIATPHFSFAQIPALDTVIVDRVGAGGYRLPKRPYIDMRVALMELARARALRIVLGDFPLPLEYRSSERPLKVSSSIDLIDARAEREPGEEWHAIPEPLLARIREELAVGGRVALFAARKAYAQTVVCRDCGEVLRDDRGKVYGFTIEGGTRLFRTADGTRTRATDTKCPNCESWNLLPLGVGVERVHEEMARLFPDAAGALFDADTVRTVTGAKRRMSMLAEPGSYIVGTEGMAPWLLAASPAPLSLAAIVSADSLLALPFWRARERFLRLGFLLSALAPRTVVATRLPEDSAVRTLANPRIPAFFEEEARMRKALGYPPFGTLISLTWQGTERALDVTEQSVMNGVQQYPFRRVSDRLVRGSVSQRTIVLSLPKDAWPDADLSARLASLPPSVRVLVDPESFW